MTGLLNPFRFAPAVVRSPYALAALADAPKMYHTFNYVAVPAGAYADISGYANDAGHVGTSPLVGASLCSTDVAADARCYSNTAGSTGRYLLVPYASTIGTTDFTIEGLVNASSGTGVKTYVARAGSGVGNAWALRRGVGGGTSLQLTAWSGGVATTIAYGSFFNSTIYHFAASVSGTAMKLYVNNVLRASGTLPGSMDTGGSEPLTIGSYGGNTSPMIGLLDELAFYDFELSAARIAVHYAAR